MNCVDGAIWWDDLPGVCVRPLGDAALKVHVLDEIRRDDVVEAASERAWQQHRLTHPRDYDGTILDVQSIDAQRGELCVRRERYRFLAIGAAIGARARLLAVTGVVTAVDQDGDECVLLGRRSAETRIYGGRWELAPSGGIKTPSVSVREFGIEHVRRGLIEEAFEELGVAFTGFAVEAVAIVSDDEAASDDVLLRVRLPEAIDSRRGVCASADAGAWEYVETAWVPTSRLGVWIGRSPGAMIPPSVAVARWLGWAG